MSAPRPIVLVTGGRDYLDRARVWAELDALNPGLVVEGGADGADRHAREWCHARGVRLLTVPALWTAHGPSAGPTRNRDMVEMARRIGCRLCLAFPGGAGTADCARRAEAAGLEVRHIRDELRARAEADPLIRRLASAVGGAVDHVEPMPLGVRS